MIGLEDIAGIKSAKEGKAVALAIYNQLLEEKRINQSVELASKWMEVGMADETDSEAEHD